MPIPALALALAIPDVMRIVVLVVVALVVVRLVMIAAIMLVVAVAVLLVVVLVVLAAVLLVVVLQITRPASYSSGRPGESEASPPSSSPSCSPPCSPSSCSPPPSLCSPPSCSSSSAAHVGPCRLVVGASVLIAIVIVGTSPTLCTVLLPPEIPAEASIRGGELSMRAYEKGEGGDEVAGRPFVGIGRLTSSSRSVRRDMAEMLGVGASRRYCVHNGCRRLPPSSCWLPPSWPSTWRPPWSSPWTLLRCDRVSVLKMGATERARRGHGGCQNLRRRCSVCGGMVRRADERWRRRTSWISHFVGLPSFFQPPIPSFVRHVRRASRQGQGGARREGGWRRMLMLTVEQVRSTVNSRFKLRFGVCRAPPAHRRRRQSGGFPATFRASYTVSRLYITIGTLI
jgi:hypothetical protein